MFGILDRVYQFKKSFKNFKESDFKVKDFIFNDVETNENWIYFVPSAPIKYSVLRNSLFPDNRKVYAYVVDYHELLMPSLKETNLRLRQIYEKACNLIEDKLAKQEKINIVGVSLGNVLAFRTAASYQCEKLVSIAGGSRLGACAWDSILAGPYAKASGLDRESYLEALIEFDPLTYLNNLKTNEIFIYFGSHDIIANSRHAIDLVEELNKAGKYPKVKKFKFADHGPTIYLAGKDLK